MKGRLSQEKSRSQKTLAGPVEISGIGLFTGISVTIKILPAKEDFGIVFKRVDLPNAPEVKASLSSVVATPRCTVLGNGEAVVQTVEHLLAALAAYEIDNVLIEINGPEIPILDGSAKQFVEKIEAVGTKELSKAKPIYTLKNPVYYSDKDIHIIAIPSDEFRVSFTLQFPSTHSIATQFASFPVNASIFAKDIAPARTFSAYEEIAPLIEKGVIKGGSLENAVLIQEGKVRNPEGLRMPDEFVRHKILDVIGDLSLINFSFKAHITAIRSGHASNFAFAKVLESHLRKSIQEGERIMGDHSSKNLSTVFDVKEIAKILPHRYPFLLVDRIVYLSLEENVIIGQKSVTMNEQFFQGHFPDVPIMPGVLILEALAQTGGILVHQNGYNDRIAVLLNINNAKFRRPVVPGDQLMLHAQGLHFSSKGGRVLAKATVNGQLAVEAEIGFALVHKEQL